MKYNFYIIQIVCVLLVACDNKSELGVSYNLAKQRKQSIEDVNYTMHLAIPRLQNEPILAAETISFNLKSSDSDVLLDFVAPDSNLSSVRVNGLDLVAKIENAHIRIPSSLLLKGANSVDIMFIAGDMSLNRKPDFMYSLLVPDRASTVFPCFDQPDLKAIFNLSLSIPKGWLAVANASVDSLLSVDTCVRYWFSPTQPISTYLFAFATGSFHVDSSCCDGRTIKMFYRETDSDKVKRNSDIIFRTHFNSLRWLEQYTQVKYPFQKLDIVLIPDFQYGGMEHAGCIFYNEGRLMLDKNPSENQQLNQANLIAHEVSHQWFGNLVTMRWFNDVWLKEVFAGLMADKVVNPQYPDINHDLRFILSHFPRAYSVDRTAGSNPIGQQLDNMIMAGTLYGDIIYHKAPIAFSQLESILGEDMFQLGLQKYLKKNYMANADWSNLIEILDSLTTFDLKRWSKQWVYSVGIPQISCFISNNTLKLSQDEKCAMLPMKYSILINNKEVDVEHFEQYVGIEKLDGNQLDYLPNYNGKGYGIFVLPDKQLNDVINTDININNDVVRASCFLNLHELFLQGRIDVNQYFNFLVTNLQHEQAPQILNFLSSNIHTVFWRFMSNAEREANAEFVEGVLQKMWQSNSLQQSERKQLFMLYSRVGISKKAKNLILNVWSKQHVFDGVELSENDFVNLSYELALRGIPQADSILNEQQKRIMNPDSRLKYQFVMRAVTPNETIRRNFIQSLTLASNRRPEPWVADALRYFNHPLRSDFAQDYLLQLLSLLPEIQRTGDIFFPKMWLDALLWGHNSMQAMQIVDGWYEVNKQLSPNLKNKYLQSVDLMRRSINMCKTK